MSVHLSARSFSLPCLPPSVRGESPPWSLSPYECCCIIDTTSPPEQLEKEFHAWLSLDSSPRTSVSSAGSKTQREPREDDYDDMDDVTMTNLDAPFPSPPADTDPRKGKKKENKHGRPYCPGRPLSMDERQQIINYHLSGMKVNAIATALCISHGCVSKIIKRFKQTESISPVSSPKHRKQRRKRSVPDASATSSPDSSSTPCAYSSQTFAQMSPMSSSSATSLSLPSTNTSILPVSLAHLPIQSIHSLPPSPHSNPTARPTFAITQPAFGDQSGPTYTFMQPISSIPEVALTSNGSNPAPVPDYMQYNYFYSPWT